MRGVARLVASLNDSSSGVASRAFTALIAALAHPKPNTCLRSIVALGRIADGRAVGPLLAIVMS